MTNPDHDLERPGECTTQGLTGFLKRPAVVLGSITRADIPADVVAGLTVAAVAIPQAIAYASVAELPAQTGLYTACVAAIVGSLWGCSRFLATGPVNASSLLVFPILLAVAEPGKPEYLLAAGVLAILAGLFRIALALMHFGALVTLASKSVLIGFTAGAAMHIGIGQIRHLLGLNVQAVPELYRLVGAIASNLNETNTSALGVGLATLVIVTIVRRLSSRAPAALLGLTCAASAVFFLGLDEAGVALVGAIPRSLPPATWITAGSWPEFELVRSLLVGSMAVAALGLIEATAASQTLARQSGDRLNNNQEFFGQGMANIAAGLLSGYPCSGSFTRSALAHQSGARTHLTGMVTGFAILIGMLVFGPLASLIPKSAIAGVLLYVAWNMVDREAVMRVIKTSREEASIMIITFVATLVLPLDFAILSGIVFSLAFFVVKSSLPRLVPVVPDPTFRHFVNNPSAPVCPQLAVMNIRGPLFFGAVYHLEEELRDNHRKHPGQNLVVLRMHGVDICDLTGIEMLESTVQTYRRIGGDVFLIRPRRPVLEVMEHSGFLDILGRDHILEQEGAIEHLFEHVLDPAVCIYECEERVFAECQALNKHPYEPDLPPTSFHATSSDELHVSPARFSELKAEEGVIAIDVREPEEYEQGHIPGTRMLPLRVLMNTELPRDCHLIFSCRSGRRTNRVLRMLEERGFEQLNGLRGGILAWRAEGLPVEVPADDDDLDIWQPGN